MWNLDLGSVGTWSFDYWGLRGWECFCVERCFLEEQHVGRQQSSALNDSVSQSGTWQSTTIRFASQSFPKTKLLKCAVRMGAIKWFSKKLLAFALCIWLLRQENKVEVRIEFPEFKNKFIEVKSWTDKPIHRHASWESQPIAGGCSSEELPCDKQKFFCNRLSWKHRLSAEPQHE